MHYVSRANGFDRPDCCGYPSSMATAQQLRERLAREPGPRIQEYFQDCLDALDHGLYEEILEGIAPLLDGAQASDRLAWQIKGLALRELQDSRGAHQAFEQASRISPNEPLIVHSMARTALEAGYPAAALFAQAKALAPRDSRVLLGEAAAMLAEGDGIAACALLGSILEENPGWIEGHKTYARISAMAQPEKDRQASMRAALARYPGDMVLWGALIEVAMQADDYNLARDTIEQARAALGRDPEFDRVEAICRNETSDPAGALAIFGELPAPQSPQEMAHVLRCLIQLERFEEADQLAAERFPGDADLAIWPYRALIWRAMGDPRWDWLEGDERLIGTYDLSSAVGSLDALADVLRSIHRGTGAPIDQSVRGGTQTDGNLLARAEPEIRQLRSAILDAVSQHVAQLPSAREGHPTLLEQRGPIRVQGAWSVRLLSEGFHVDHVHPQGWLSSAFYALLPEGAGGIGRAGASEDGWLAFGECRKLLPQLKAFRTFEPRAGHLALFPSTMWHATRPFSAGERMTVAFDIARPRP